MRVLLVEDEADIADALQRFLQAQGHAVSAAERGQDREQNREQDREQDRDQRLAA